jgi:hypothetical protein
MKYVSTFLITMMLSASLFAQVAPQVQQYTMYDERVVTERTGGIFIGCVLGRVSSILDAGLGVSDEQVFKNASMCRKMAVELLPTDYKKVKLSEESQTALDTVEKNFVTSILKYMKEHPVEAAPKLSI